MKPLSKVASPYNDLFINGPHYENIKCTYLKIILSYCPNIL